MSKIDQQEYQVFYTSIVLIVLIVGIVAIVSVYKQPYSLLHYSSFSGHSMCPELSPREFITLFTTTDLYVGDIIAFREENISIVHRIIEINSTHIITKGDNNQYLDKSILLEDVIGLVINHSPVPTSERC